MLSTIKPQLPILLASALWGGGLIYPLSAGFAQGTAFTYQGRLNDAGGPAHGAYDITFALYPDANSSAPVSATVTNSGTFVTNGLFLASLDFGGAPFNGAPLWLELGVRTNGAAAFFTLSPRQPISPAPYAIYAASANATNLIGTVPAGSVAGAALRAGGNAFSGTQSITNGRLGVGATVPTASLEVRTASDARAAVFSGPTGGGWSTYKTTGDGNPYLWDFRGDTNGFIISRSSVAIDLFMSYDTGNLGLGTTAPAAQLDVAGSIHSNGRSVPVTDSDVRIVSGIVKGDGTLYSGTGFTVARTSGGQPAGDYTITFTPPFSAIPAVTVTPVNGPNTICVISGLGNFQSFITQYVNGALNDGAYFSFIAIGPR